MTADFTVEVPTTLEPLRTRNFDFAGKTLDEHTFPAPDASPFSEAIRVHLTFLPFATPSSTTNGFLAHFFPAVTDT